MSKFVSLMLCVLFLLFSGFATAKSPKVKHPVPKVVQVDAYREAVAWFRGEFENRTSVNHLIDEQYAFCTQPIRDQILAKQAEQDKLNRELEYCLALHARQLKEQDPNPMDCSVALGNKITSDESIRLLESNLALCTKLTMAPIDDRARFWARCAYEQFSFAELRAKEMEKTLDASFSSDFEVINTLASVRNFLLGQIGNVCGTVPQLGATECRIGKTEYFPSDIEKAIIFSRNIPTEIMPSKFTPGDEPLRVQWWSKENPDMPVLHVCTLRKAAIQANIGGTTAYEGCPDKIYRKIFYSWE